MSSQLRAAQDLALPQKKTLAQWGLVYKAKHLSMHTFKRGDGKISEAQDIQEYLQVLPGNMQKVLRIESEGLDAVYQEADQQVSPRNSLTCCSHQGP